MGRACTDPSGRPRAGVGGSVVSSLESMGMSWFVVSLRYIAPLEAIDAAMRAHVAFLEEHRKAGVFMAWGRKVPRTGGIILARGESRADIERILKDDPFVTRSLADVEVTEFLPKPAAVVKGVQRLVDPKQRDA
jgi:uncharacterized protein YciI